MSTAYIELYNLACWGMFLYIWFDTLNLILSSVEHNSERTIGARNAVNILVENESITV
jgi:hypothetical protein